MLSEKFVAAVEGVVGARHVRRDAASLEAYGTDALRRGRSPDVVVLPGTTAEVAEIARLCGDSGVPLTPRGGGTGYTGGAVPTSGGLLLALDRFNRILEIDEPNLLAVVEPNVVTATLQAAVEQVGLFYPPDPASLQQSVIGGNVAECAGGPRAFKYGTTKRYVLGLEAVLPTGEVIQTGGKSVKNVVGYDLTQLLVGSEGTLAIITKIILRLIPKPTDQATLRVAFVNVMAAVKAAGRLVSRRVIPAALELIDAACLDAIADHLGTRMAPEGTGAVLLIEVDGMAPTVAAEVDHVVHACRSAGAIDIRLAKNDEEREELWAVRRELSLALRACAPLKINHDVVVPKGRVPNLFRVVDALRREFDLPMPSFGHVGDGNIHVNILVDPDDKAAMTRARTAERRLFEAVVELEGSISGEHGIGFSKAEYLPLELSMETIAVMRRLKDAFDPHHILNPGKIFPTDAEN